VEGSRFARDTFVYVDDRELLDAWREGNSRAGAKLLRSYFEQVRRIFINKAGVDVERAILATFSRCREAREGLNGRSEVLTYFLAVALAVYRDILRGLREPNVLEFPPLFPSETNPLRRALRAVGTEEQILLELAHFHGLTPARTGDVLGVGERDVLARLRHALHLLRGALEREEHPDPEPCA
jgi:DNA-directed RNA polymerase specialized sigma24 family protein